MPQEQVKYVRDAIPMMRDAFIAKLQEFSQLPEETWQKTENKIELRCVLVNQFPKLVDQYAIIDLLGFNGAYVLWDLNPNNTWHSILEEVIGSRFSIADLLQACIDFPNAEIPINTGAVDQLQSFATYSAADWAEADGTQLLELRETIAVLLYRSDDISTIVQASNLDPGNIEWDSRPINIWHSIIEQVGRSSYPELIQACMDLVEERHSGMLD